MTYDLCLVSKAERIMINNYLLYDLNFINERNCFVKADLEIIIGNITDSLKKKYPDSLNLIHFRDYSKDTTAYNPSELFKQTYIKIKDELDIIGPIDIFGRKIDEPNELKYKNIF